MSMDSMLTLEQKYERAIACLKKIAEFDHVDTCTSGAPVHECGCYEQDSEELAATCLRDLGE